MKTRTQPEDLYEFELGAFEFLTTIGFVRETDASRTQSIRETRYRSDRFLFTIGVHLGRDENFRILRRCADACVVPDPIVPLQFFLRDFDAERIALELTLAEADSVKRALLTEAELCKLNPWVFTTDAWTTDLQFTSAVSAAREWMWQQPTLRDAIGNMFLAKLRSFRTQDTRAYP